MSSSGPCFRFLLARLLLSLPLAPSFALPAFSLGPFAALPPPPPASSLLPLPSSLPSSLAPPLFSFDSSASASFPTHALHAPVVPGAGISSGAPPSASGAFAPGWSGAAGSSDTDNTYLYNDCDDSSVKEEKEEAALSKAAFSQAFHEVVSLFTGFFPRAKPSSSSSSTEDWILWEDICGPSSGCDPRIFVLFDKIKFLLKEVCEKFQKAADKKNKTSSTLPHWWDFIGLGTYLTSDYHKTLKINENFSHLLDKPVVSSRYVTLSISDITKLEACGRSVVLFVVHSHNVRVPQVLKLCSLELSVQAADLVYDESSRYPS